MNYYNKYIRSNTDFDLFCYQTYAEYVTEKKKWNEDSDIVSRSEYIGMNYSSLKADFKEFMLDKDGDE